MSHALLNGSPSAITDTVEVLDDVRKYYPGERLIYLSPLNYLGIPWKRFKKFDQTFFYQNLVVNALKEKSQRLSQLKSSSQTLGTGGQRYHSRASKPQFNLRRP